MYWRGEFQIFALYRYIQQKIYFNYVYSYRNKDNRDFFEIVNFQNQF